MNTEDLLFVGLCGRVLAVNRCTGQTLWETPLKGSLFGTDFVNLFCDRGLLFVHTQGRLFCLDASDGRIKWENPLKGCGYGLATLASVAGSSGGPAAQASQLHHAARAD